MPSVTDHTNTMTERLTALNGRIAAASARAGHAAAVTLVAVSKKQPAEAVRAARAAGQTVFGENYAQEGIAKRAALADDALTWHHIGPIQSNKCADIAEHFDWAQGVDRERIVRRLGTARGTARPPLQVCVQVNASGEASKSGVAPDDAEALCEAVLAQPGLTLRGLMCIPARDDGERAFTAMRALFDRLRDRGLPLDTLSMGMSDDFETAIACGATMVRVGSALFGARD
ncbi:YggS family pyridoxal phosphate-dependent enzyme [Algiphilus sp.]|uniref:YggS family pyridoxal phosphate-dependent enzyme n=2 Tax=Algiphilus sp. TaxID=1872431 RepID=UPI003C65D90F